MNHILRKKNYNKKRISAYVANSLTHREAAQILNPVLLKLTKNGGKRSAAMN